MWDKLTYNLGTIKAGVKQTMVHKYLGADIDIRSVVLACSCTGYKIDKKNKTISIEFVPNKVPKTLRAMGKNSYNVEKNTIVVSVVNNKEQIDTFKFKATVKDK